MRIVIPIIMLLLMSGLFANAGRQTYLWVKAVFDSTNPLIYGIVYGLVVVAILAAFIASRVPNIGVPRVIFLIGHHALGLLIYLVMIVNIVSLILLIGRLARLIPPPMPHSVQLIPGALSLLLVVGFTLYGSIHATNIQTKRYTVQLGQGQAETESLRIALISDTHLGYVNSENHLAKIVAAVNAMNPDIICIAGDIFDGDMTALSDTQKLQSLFLEMEATYGVYACLGNHDAGASYEEMLTFLEDTNITVLMDEAVVIDERFVLVGRRDSSPIGGQGSSREDIKGVPEANDLPVIVMDHQPGNIDEYGSEVDLILSGHTHKGQFFPFNLFTNGMYTVDYGYYRASDTDPHVIVTSGAGTWGPAQRVASDNEVVEINVTFPVQS